MNMCTVGVYGMLMKVFNTTKAFLAYNFVHQMDSMYVSGLSIQIVDNYENSK